MNKKVYWSWEQVFAIVFVVAIIIYLAAWVMVALPYVDECQAAGYDSVSTTWNLQAECVKGEVRVPYSQVHEDIHDAIREGGQ